MATGTLPAMASKRATKAASKKTTKATTKPAKRATAAPAKTPAKRAKKAPAKTTKKKSAAPKIQAGTPRGPALIAAILAKLSGPKSPIGEPRPLDAAGLRAFEESAGVALSPSLHAVLAHDAGWLARHYGWFDAQGRFLARPTFDVIAEHAGVFAEAYEEVCAARFPGKAIALDQGSDSMRLLYFGDPDEHGEYPVLDTDHDDVPSLGVAAAGIDVWLAQMLDVKLGADAARDQAATSKRILGSKSDWAMDIPGGAALLPAPKAGPAPGSVSFAPIVVGAGDKSRRLSDKQLTKALAEHAELGDEQRLGELVADAKARGLPRKALDDALVKAAQGGNEGALHLLLAAGASPNARDYYGAALSRLISYDRSAALARILLDAGADPNGPSVNGKTALFGAVERSSLEMTRLLLERGADPLHRETNGMTPLHTAAQGQTNPAMVDLLLDHGASTEAGKNHSRPLHWAIEGRNRDVARRLVARGADVNAKSDYLGRTALHIAFECGDDVMAGELVRAGADRALADARGITLAEVYGPGGEDVRPFDCHYVPSAEEQRLTIALRLAVTNHHAMRNLYYPPLHADFWASLINHGLAAGSAFDPVESRARVVASFDPRTVKRSGFHDAKLELMIAGVAPELLRLVAGKLLGSAVVFTGAGVGAAIRTVALSIRGSREGRSAMDAATLRACFDDDGVQLGAYEGTLPFAFRVEKGAAALTVVPDGAVKDAASAHILTAGTAWLAVAEMWPRRALGPPPFYMLSPDPSVKGAARFTLLAPAAPKGERNAFPFAHEPAEAALRNAMRALHAKVALREVVLTLPG